jgi:hypothetical protein
VTVMLESHPVGEEEHRKGCSFCTLAFALIEAFEGHSVEEVWEVVTTVMLRAMSESAAEDDRRFIGMAQRFQFTFAENMVCCLMERLAASERAGMH